MNAIKIPQDVLYIIKTLNNNKFEAYIVGGCVRDTLINIEAKDWDITTSAKPNEIKKYFNKTVDTGIKHGTITVVINKQNYEVTTYRIDGEYKDCRHPNKIFFTTKLKEDILRRDFTMNAIAYHHEEGFKDYFNGIEDINNKIIRGVGNANERFNEDALRMLRALRFSTQLGFQIEKETFIALKNNVKLIKKISIERIRDEITKLLKGKFTNNIPLLWESGLLIEISEKLYENTIKNQLILMNAFKYKPNNHILCWSIFLNGFTEKTAIEILKYFKFDTDTIKKVSKLVGNINLKFPENRYEIKKYANIFGDENISNYFKLYSYLYNYQKGIYAEIEYNKIINNNECIFQKDMNINGNDLIKIGIQKGTKIGEILLKLLDFVHKNPNKNKKNLLIKEAQKYI